MADKGSRPTTMSKSIYDLELHDCLSIPMDIAVDRRCYKEKLLTILKVPGGWLYGWDGKIEVFVPFMDERIPDPDTLHDAIRYICETPGMTADIAISVLSSIKKESRELKNG